MHKRMTSSCDCRWLLLPATIAFVYIQIWLFGIHSYIDDGHTPALDYDYQHAHQKRLQHSQNVDLRKKSSGGSFHMSDKILTNRHEPVAAVVIMACNRADYLERAIKSVLKYQEPIASKFPLFVSQDGLDPTVKSLALRYTQLKYMQHLDSETLETKGRGEMIAYYKIARHYKWALDQMFQSYNFTRVIILEDDMEIAPDFFEYFEAAAVLLEKDTSIMAVSSWNDNGQKQFVADPYALYRSDFFPGLGWMLSRPIWEELSLKWPKAYWDDWLRLKENRRGRQFVRPEVCRTYNFGEHGSSLGQFFTKFLEPIKLNDVLVDWKSVDLRYLLKDNYAKYFRELLKNTTVAQGDGIKIHNIKGDVRIHYKDQYDFENIARQFGIFEEWKDGVPRTAYYGVVTFREGGRRIFLVGPDSPRLLAFDKL